MVSCKPEILYFSFAHQRRIRKENQYVEMAMIYFNLLGQHAAPQNIPHIVRDVQVGLQVYLSYTPSLVYDNKQKMTSSFPHAILAGLCKSPAQSAFLPEPLKKLWPFYFLHFFHSFFLSFVESLPSEVQSLQAFLIMRIK